MRKKRLDIVGLVTFQNGMEIKTGASLDGFQGGEHINQNFVHIIIWLTMRVIVCITKIVMPPRPSPLLN